MDQLPKKQVFQTSSPTRWRIVKSVLILLLVIFAVGLCVFGMSVLRPTKPILPLLAKKGEIDKLMLNPDNILSIKSKHNAEFKKERKDLKQKATFDYEVEQRIKRHIASVKHDTTNIRAAFYVNWDRQSYSSLKANLDKLNMVFPEWFFVPDGTNKVSINIDPKALKLCKDANVPIVPMISNFFNGKWNGQNVHRVIGTKQNRTEFINSVIVMLDKYKFQGVNIDFEDLTETTDEYLIAFQKELYTALHSRKYLVTQDISPFNEDYNLKELPKYNDYLILMAYDQHSEGSKPGPVADFKWVELALETFAKNIPDKKIILGLPAYGYDWAANAEGQEVDFQQAVSIAKNYKSVIQYDNSGYNISFTYVDVDNIKHEVYLTDAATLFNLCRLADDYGTAGTAMWRLGAEDFRMWSYYGKDLSYPMLVKNPFAYESLRRTKGNEQISYLGEGEILDLLSAPDTGRFSIEYNRVEQVIAEEEYLQYPSSYLIQRFGKKDKKMVLTFDDGPYEPYTSQILDILNKEHVPACFFITGINAENNIPILKRIYDEGYEIGNHTFTHPNLAKVSLERAKLELSATRRLIECITGHSTVLFRPPYKADADPHTYEELLPIAISKKENYYTITETIDPMDWEKDLSADSIYARVVQQENEGNIILLHDAGGDRSATVKALPRIIKYFKGKGYTFTTLADLSGKTKEELMPRLPDNNEFVITQINSITAGIVYYGENILFVLFLLALFLSLVRMILLAILAGIEKRKEKKPSLFANNTELVSVIIPAYNEEVTALQTIDTILKSSYKNLEVIVVDDGSKDRTLENLKNQYAFNPQIKILGKQNGGKASALNYGIGYANGAILVCIDADTQLESNAIEKLIEGFEDESVGAVAGNVRIGNDVNILTEWQSIEYITSQNFDRRAFHLLNCITVIPGAIGAFRKETVEAAGGFTTDTLAEDCDLTIRILKSGKRINYSPEAKALTEAPETLKMFIKQRFRWSFGIMQCVYKHRNVLFRNKYKTLGWIALPNLILFQILLPILSPLADIFMMVGLLAGNGDQVLFYYLLFVGIEMIAGAIALLTEKESLLKLWSLPFQRFAYRQIMYYVIIHSIYKAIKGELQGWGTQKRTGKVVLNEQVENLSLA